MIRSVCRAFVDVRRGPLRRRLRLPGGYEVADLQGFYRTDELLCDSQAVVDAAMLGNPCTYASFGKFAAAVAVGCLRIQALEPLSA